MSVSKANTDHGESYRAPYDDVLGDLDASALAAHIARKEITAGEAVDAAIARLQAAEPVLHATVCERFDVARTIAAQTLVQGVFAGVPSVIKDNTNLAGLPTRHGSRATPDKPVQKNDPFAEQFMATGLIPLAKTKLPEFGIPPTVEYIEGEPAHNPWNAAYSTGGSSGGAAALVAAGVVPIAHANDGGGSIRIPAACCGLVGLKGSRGRVRDNAMIKGAPINIIGDGVVSRSVRDTAAFFAAAERSYCNPKLPALGLVEGPGKEKLRIGFFSQLPDGGDAHPECVAAMHKAAKLCEGLGHHVHSMPSPTTSAHADDFLLYYAAMCASLTYAGRWVIDRDFQADKLEPLTVGLARHFRRNITKFPATLWRLKRARREYDELMQEYDLLLTPTLGLPPPKLGYLAADLPFAQAWQRLRDYAAFTPVSNICGTPAISLPMAMSKDGLPIGVHFAAGFGQERRLLELAFALEDAAPWPLFPPKR